MCGIFGYFNLSNPKVFYEIGKLSETRGKEASGYFYIESFKLKLEKFSQNFSNREVKRKLFEKNMFQSEATFIGHTRLKTHGDENLIENNQPIFSQEVSIVHNGIVVNYGEIIIKNNLTPKSRLDSEVIVLLIKKYLKEFNLRDSIKKTLKQLSGEVSISGTYNNGEKYFLYTNTGSIYYLMNKNRVVFFSSEEWITRKIKNKYKIQGKVFQLKKNNLLILESNGMVENQFYQETTGVEENTYLFKDLKRIENEFIYTPKLKRCKKCILPETVPFIFFDDFGVCSFCLNHKKHQLKNSEELKNLIKNEKNIIVGFSGGRDSSFGLRELKRFTEANLIAVSYDWGMITDLARRNQSRVVGKLGIEHIWVSADIKRKRENIKKNLEAWFKKPELGMVPILMAGDKEWQKQLSIAAKRKNAQKIVQLQSPFEHTYFKYGFAGIKPIFRSSINIDNKFKKFNLTIRLFMFYLINFIKNPKYINSSILDSFKGFFAFYFQTSKIISLFEYVEFNEIFINETLQKDFNWECDPTTPTTWRIGDGTTPLYNMIYWKMVGFTENDFFRSNQIRENHLTREEALEIIKLENQPRYERIKEYCELIAIDYKYVKNELEKLDNLSIVKEWVKEIG